MRKQYHLRPGPQGLRAWDVHRLIELTEHLPVRQVPLSAIQELDEPYWFAEGGIEPTCRAVAEHACLMAEADLCYPVILSSNGRVMDGMHRIAKAAMQGEAYILAVQFEHDPEPHYVGVHPDDLPY
ncbi:hypothetical protein [Chitinimonas sp. BJB300]|uniref:hypothetical protein n=1 Tax=Chitinimonas sp. BJB300 TaxID=1559339 RepID=UPI000C118AAC|nr:hypothetical protein [Chitinimonas sp. BJB300]PHV10507.1 hypothetical protein CSQ89_15830 [Chitinimonas sp. BJB300]TSJ90754.1 hypothetical protein FG002_000050 [Chitinimonas sp. BJB300]